MAFKDNLLPEVDLEGNCGTAQSSEHGSMAQEYPWVHWNLWALGWQALSYSLALFNKVIANFKSITLCLTLCYCLFLTVTCVGVHQTANGTNLFLLLAEE